MRVLIANHQDPDDIEVFSGTSYFMSRGIRERFLHTEQLDIIEQKYIVKMLLDNGFRNTLKPLGEKLSNFLRNNIEKIDFVICQGGNAALAFYKYNIPVVFWHDSIWLTYMQLDKNRESFEYFKSKYPKLYQWDKRVLENAHTIFLSSDYIADACIKFYRIKKEKIKVIPFGANVPEAKNPVTRQSFLKKRLKSKTLNLTFIGKDWVRKGLSKAVSLATALKRMKIPVQLTVIGCEPDIKAVYDSEYIKLIKYIEKSNSADVDLFEQVMGQTHFLIHPCIAEPFGVVICEANSYGIPVIGTKVGGLKTSINDGFNGFLFEEKNFVSKSVKLLNNIYLQLDEKYPTLFDNALKEYELRLNWEIGVKCLEKHMEVRL